MYVHFKSDGVHQCVHVADRESTKGGGLEGPVYLPKSLRRPESHAAASWSTAWKDMGQMGAV